MDRSRKAFGKRKFVKKKKFHYNFLNPYSADLRSFSRAGRKFKYFETYHLKHNGNVECGEGAILIEWLHKKDQYIVHAVNVPVDGKSTKSVRNITMTDLSPSFKDNKIDSSESIFFIFDFYKTHLGINMRVRHLPTFVEILAWNNKTVPSLSLIRDGHEQELRNFLGTNLRTSNTKTGSPFDGLLLNRIEKECGAH